MNRSFSQSKLQQGWVGGGYNQKGFTVTMQTDGPITGALISGILQYIIYRLTDIGYRYRLSDIGFRISATGYQLSAFGIGYRLPAIRYRYRISSIGFRYRISAFGYRILPIGIGIVYRILYIVYRISYIVWKTLILTNNDTKMSRILGGVGMTL